MSAVLTPSASPGTPPSGPLHRRIAWHLRHNPKRELWFAWWVMVIFYQLYGVLFFFVTRVQPPPSPAWDTATVARWFDDHGLGIRAGFRAGPGKRLEHAAELAHWAGIQGADRLDHALLEEPVRLG